MTRALDLEAAALYVDVHHAQDGRLAPSETAVRQNQNEQSEVVCGAAVHALADPVDGLGEACDLLVRKITLLGFADFRNLKTARRVDR